MKPYMPAASTRRRSDRVSIASLIEFERNDVAGRYFSHRRSTTTVWGFWCYVALSHMARSEQGIEFRRISGRTRCPSRNHYLGVVVILFANWRCGSQGG